ncbi:MAG: Z1 domain-containing protein [Parvibaculum sp.]
MPGPQVDTLVRQILAALPRTQDLDGAIEDVVSGLESLIPGFSQSHATEIAEARREVERQFADVEILHRHSVIIKRPRWYFGSRPTDLHWPALKQYLLSKGWAEGDIDAIDEASNEIISLLEDPSKEQFSCRGMVVGHVQSGKTANMTAVIAKGLDAGYDTVIVLAGLTNKLRHQTQLRLFNDLVKRDELLWNVRTPNDEYADFRAPPQGGFLSNVGKAQIAVVKKNVSPLKQLKIAVNGTHAVALRRIRVLVIDDECDQASVNAGRGELDVTAINQKIRELLGMLPAVTYVGYTATPFANVLIDPYRTDVRDERELDDLYPRDFITALPASPNYFGTEKLFGRTPEDPDNVQPEEEGLDMIRDIPTDEEALLQPRSAKDRDSFSPEITDSLADAILYFLGCCAARLARGDVGKHMTMLVHTSAYVVAHERVAECIRDWVDAICDTVTDPESEYGQRLAQGWEREQGRLPADISSAEPVSVETIFMHLQEVLDALEFPVENGSSEDRIDYKEAARTYIVVGGSILARGLTLEGLMVSYFLRSANQYDTLLQMGRWFGYRPNYEDLPRIWMPEDLKLKFRNLARVEMEIRQDIERYHLENLTPQDIAVRIRAIPGMAITGATKMRAAKTSAISYWGTHRQTFRFEHRNSDALRANWKAASDLLHEASRRGRRTSDWKAPLWKSVPKESVLSFLESYGFHRDHSDLQPNVLLPFLRQADPRLSEWNIGIVEAGSGRESDEPLGPLESVRLVNRARLKDSGETVDIKALMSKGDIWLDCPGPPPSAQGWEDLKQTRLGEVGQLPLLLLYPIDRKSSPRTASNAREPLDAVEDVLGVGIVFPGSVTEGARFVSVELQTLSADEIEQIDAEEAAQAEAAGV